ncbi:unnamed protein product, partial [Allacma fusca]
NQVNANYFGFSGYFFTVTYEFLGGVIGIIVTYAFIIGQQFSNSAFVVAA